MKQILILIFLIYLNYINGLYSTDFSTVMNELKNLEKYIREYYEENSPNYSLTHLITAYIRLGAYTGDSWTIAGGSIPDDLSDYIKDKDSSEGTNAQSCQTYRQIDLPNNETLDFVHFFAVMNGIEHSGSYSGSIAHLVGWGGDTFQLLQDIKNEEGNLEQLMEKAKTYFLKKGGFDMADFISDLDAPIILKKKNDDNDFENLIQKYYNSKEYLDRINKFVELTFPSLKKKSKFREEIFDSYSSNYYIKILECKDGIRDGTLKCLVPGSIKEEYTENQKAAVYVFSDCLSENYKEESEEKESKDEDNFSNNLLNMPLIYLFSLFILIL